MIEQEQINYLDYCFVCKEISMVVTCTDGKYAVCTTCGSRQKINEESKNIMTNKKEETKEKIFEENILGEK